jgi:hypothetical protein
MSSGKTSPAKNPRKNIFINYRVHDTAGETGRLVDKLKQYFNADQIFMDIDKIEPGVDFTKAISNSLESCDIMLAVIGPRWLGINQETNSSRIKDPNDWVKTEISTALERDIRVVPVLVDGGQLPASEELPEDLQPLLLRQTYEISNKRWDYDTEQLINFLIKSGVQPKKRLAEPVASEKTWWKKNSWWIYILIGIAIVIGGIMLLPDDTATEAASTEETTDQVDENADAVADANIDGTWEEHRDVEAFTFVLTQEENSISGKAFYGKDVHDVSGNITGNELSLDIQEFGNLKGEVSDDGNTIIGDITDSSDGHVEKITLMRK